METNRNFSLIIAIVLAVMLLSTAGLQAQVTVETIALTGFQAPGTEPGVVFNGSFGWSGGQPYSYSVINNLGQVVIPAGLSGVGISNANDRGTFFGTSYADLTLIAREGDPAPDTTGGLIFGDAYQWSMGVDMPAINSTVISSPALFRAKGRRFLLATPY